MNFTQLFETSTLGAHQFELLHNVDIVGNQSRPETLGDIFVAIKGRIVPYGLFPLNYIVLDNLDLLEAFLLVESFKIFLKLGKFMDNFVWLNMVAYGHILFIQSEVPDDFKNFP